MTGKEFQYVNCTIDNEGFEYTFTGYSHFKEIKDPKFHKLRVAYLKAGQQLAQYLGDAETADIYGSAK